MQCYVSSPSLTTSICTTHLPPNLQSFIKTPSLENEHSPMHPIPNPSIMVEATLGVTTRVEATNKGEGRLHEKCKLSTMSLTILPCTCYNFLFVIVVFDLGDYVLQVYNVFMVVWV